MSNHAGGHMLNEVLHLLEERGFFKSLSKKEMHEFAKQVLKIGCDWDCNNGEILEEIGRRFCICYCCQEYLDPSQPENDGLCKACAA